MMAVIWYSIDYRTGVAEIAAQAAAIERAKRLLARFGIALREEPASGGYRDFQACVPAEQLTAVCDALAAVAAVPVAIDRDDDTETAIAGQACRS